jgi:hypothetical protein
MKSKWDKAYLTKFIIKTPALTCRNHYLLSTIMIRWFFLDAEKDTLKVTHFHNAAGNDAPFV